MLRYLLPALLVLITAIEAAGKRNERDLVATASAFDRALERKDTIVLNRLLSPEIKYGHSNGWIETKKDVIADLYNGKLTYNSIRRNDSTSLVIIEGATGLIRTQLTVDILIDGQPLKMNLSVLQVWIYKKSSWILLGRQSVKV